MPEIIIDGTYKLNGTTKIQGSKNAVLPIVASLVLIDGKSVIKNCPNLSDVKASIKILEHLGARCIFFDNTLIVDSCGICKNNIPDYLMREMRSSSLFLGAVLGRMNEVSLSTPGGCELGPRPIDLHIKALKKLGATVNDSNGFLTFKAENGLNGNKIHLSFPSVGATENVILSAVTAKGTTVLQNAAREPEIIDLAKFLNNAGGKISGAGSDLIVIEGVSRLKGTEHTVISDRIVASTYISACAVTGGEIELTDLDVSHLGACLSVFSEAGCKFYDDEKILRIKAPNRLKSVSTVRTLTYPGFATDSGPMLISALSVAKGTSVFVENIFNNRFRYIDELKRLGANIRTEGKVAIVEGVNALHGATCEATDLRGGAALVTAGLFAEGKTVITNINHIKRGYEDIVFDLSNLGAKIKEQ